MVLKSQSINLFILYENNYEIYFIPLIIIKIVIYIKHTFQEQELTMK